MKLLFLTSLILIGCGTENTRDDSRSDGDADANHYVTTGAGGETHVGGSDGGEDSDNHRPTGATRDSDTFVYTTSIPFLNVELCDADLESIAASFVREGMNIVEKSCRRGKIEIAYEAGQELPIDRLGQRQGFQIFDSSQTCWEGFDEFIEEYRTLTGLDPYVAYCDARFGRLHLEAIGTPTVQLKEMFVYNCYYEGGPNLSRLESYLNSQGISVEIVKLRSFSFMGSPCGIDRSYGLNLIYYGDDFQLKFDMILASSAPDISNPSAAARAIQSASSPYYAAFETRSSWNMSSQMFGLRVEGTPYSGEVVRYDIRYETGDDCENARTGVESYFRDVRSLDVVGSFCVEGNWEEVELYVVYDR